MSRYMLRHRSEWMAWATLAGRFALLSLEATDKARSDLADAYMAHSDFCWAMAREVRHV